MRRIYLVLLLLVPLQALAQQQERLFLPVDPDAESAFRRLEELGARGQWDRVVTGLDKLLLEGGDRLLETKDGFRSVREEARRKLLALSGDGRRAYALLHADAANALLESAALASDVEPLLEILTLHPASQAAGRARRLLVSRLVERGDPAAALPHVTQLLAGRLEEDERARLERLQVLALALCGRRGEAINALEASSAKGDATLLSRVEALQAPPPPAPKDPSALAWSQEVFGYYEITSQGSRPWSLPQADVATAYVHDGSHATAVDLETGKLRWRASLRNGNPAFERPTGLCPLALAPGVVLCALPAGAGLVALDRLDGRHLWRRSLARLQQAAKIDFDAHLATSAPPVVAGGVAAMVLVTDHRDREVHVLGVDLLSGDLAWSVFVASESGGKTPVPALARGGDRFYVVTGHGAAAAIDPHGEVLWLKKYASKRDVRKQGGNRFRMPFRPPRPGQPGAKEDPSLNAKAPGLIATQGMVWAAPADADGMFIFDATSGEERAHLLQTQAPRLLAARGKGVLALTQPGHLIEVTRANQTRLGVVGGTLDASSAVVGDVLYAAAGGGVLRVDLATGTVNVATSWKHSRGPGHLISSAGRLLVAAPRGLYAYGVAAEPGEEIPPGALLASLGDSRFGVRQAASAQLLAQREEARPLAEAAASDRDPEVSLRAMRLLGELDRVARVERWRPLVNADWEQQVPDLLNRLTHPNPEVRLGSLNAMGAIQDDPAVEVLLKDLLTDRDSRIAFTAAASLFDRDNRDGAALLASGLEDGPEIDRKRAVELFANKGTVEDLGSLAGALDDEAPQIRGIAARGVLRLHGEAPDGAEAAVTQVMQLADKDPAPEVRLAVLKACVEYKVQPEKAWAIFTRAATDANDQIRDQAVRVVSQLDSPEAYRVLGLALGDSLRETAKVAAKKLYSVAQHKDKVLLIPAEGLEKGGAQQNEHQRNYVAQIAMRYVDSGGVLSVPTLTRFASDANRQIRGYTLGGRGWGSLLTQRVMDYPCDKEAMTALSDLTLEKNPTFRRLGYEALGKAIRAPGRGDLLAQGLADEDAAIRKDCADLLLPREGEGLLDAETLLAIFKVAQQSTREEGRKAAEALLSRAPAEQLFPALVPFLAGDGEAPAKEAVALRLAGASNGELTFAAGGDVREFHRQAARWWWAKSNPGLTPEQLLVDLIDPNPSTRWRASQAAAKLPLPSVRNALVASLDAENQPWVLKEKLKALVRITGKAHGFQDKLSPAELSACAERFKTWLSRRIAAEASGER